MQQCSAEARLRGPGLRPDELPADELVAEQDGAVTEGAAGDLPGPPWEAGVPCGGRDAGAAPWPDR